MHAVVTALAPLGVTDVGPFQDIDRNGEALSSPPPPPWLLEGTWAGAPVFIKIAKTATHTAATTKWLAFKVK